MFPFSHGVVSQGGHREPGPGPVEGAYRYYRLVVTEAGNPASSAIGTIELELREELDGPTVATGGVASASQFEFNRPPAEAFDGILTANNGCLSAFASFPWWLQYDFGAGNEKKVVQYAVSSYPTSTQTNARSPGAWTLEASNDLETWVVLDTQSGHTSGWFLGTQRVFTISP